MQTLQTQMFPPNNPLHQSTGSTYHLVVDIVLNWPSSCDTLPKYVDGIRCPPVSSVAALLLLRPSIRCHVPSRTEHPERDKTVHWDVATHPGKAPFPWLRGRYISDRRSLCRLHFVQW